jgi:alanyl-tRNA synthetase
MKSAEIRDAFLTYFEGQKHTIVASSSLVPGNDPTLLFTNAGMVQFKDAFLGGEKRDYTRATSSQRCVRAGGKHNDLENVGYTARHHTFFEMLGNFSFGDYFKRDAIKYAWQFLTEELGLPEEHLWVTVHISDDEAADIWLKELGVSAERFSRLDEDNFWQMGDTGPCGPCSEIFYDHGEDVPGGPPGSENDDLDRYIEIWNLVFMQYERSADGTMEPLPKPSIDTGMGLERIAAVMQGVHSNYEIDLFQTLLKGASRITGVSDLDNTSLRVIADHIRSCSFLIVDGVVPSNEGRGYVLRRIIRRAIRHGHKLGQKEPFFHALVEILAQEMGEAYPELEKYKGLARTTILKEEYQFEKTLDRGMAVLEQALTKLQGDVIPGDVVFTLYDTYGFPVDLTNDIARERGLSLDMPGYEEAMNAQRQRARAAGSFKAPQFQLKARLLPDTNFLGYEKISAPASVVGINDKKGNVVDSISEGSEATIILDQTPFYAESGGQVGDSGYLRAAESEFDVRDCQKQGSHFLHIGVVRSGSISVGQQLDTEVNAEVRLATALNHSATHLLHSALREILGDHVTQKGSLVDSTRLRFDFSHSEAVTPEQLKAVEQRVNAEIRRNSPVETDLCNMESAQKKGAMALFGEKYGDEVRVLTMGEGFSVELCGGTHASRTGDIGLMRITSETGIAAGVRRIEAVTGDQALAYLDGLEQQLGIISRALKANRANVAQKVAVLCAESKELEKQNAQLKGKLASSTGTDLAAQARDIHGVKVLAACLDGVDPKALRDTVDQLKNKLGCAVVLLAAPGDEKVALVAGVTSDATDRIKAGELMQFVASQLGGKGGGRPDMAQGGGTDVAALPGAIDSVFEWVEKKLGS